MKNEMVEVNEDILKRAVVSRYGEGGYQRQIVSDKKVKRIVDEAKKGTVIPPVLLGNVDGTLQIIDGQHRIEARKLYKFPLFAQIVNGLSQAGAAQTFSVSASTASKISLRHRINITDGDMANAIRKIAASSGVDVMQVNYLCIGLSGNSALNMFGPCVVDVDLAIKIAKLWKDDKRFTMEGQLYNRGGVFALVGRVCKNSDNIVTAITELKKISYAKGGAIDSRYGSSYGSLSQMCDYAYRQIAKSMMGRVKK